MEVAIIKYNAGNIFSVVNALRRMDIEPVLTDDREIISRADRIIFPGQGSAETTMRYIREHHLMTSSVRCSSLCWVSVWDNNSFAATRKKAT